MTACSHVYIAECSSEKIRAAEKCFAQMPAARCTTLKKSMKRPTKGASEMEDPCETCLRWWECNGVDKDNCPLWQTNDTE